MKTVDDSGTGGGIGGSVGAVVTTVKNNKGKIVVALAMIAILAYVTAQGSAG